MGKRNEGISAEAQRRAGAGSEENTCTDKAQMQGMSARYRGGGHRWTLVLVAPRDGPNWLCVSAGSRGPGRLGPSCRLPGSTEGQTAPEIKHLFSGLPGEIFTSCANRLALLVLISVPWVAFCMRNLLSGVFDINES